MYESVLIDPWLLLLFFLMTKFQQQSIIIRCTQDRGFTICWRYKLFAETRLLGFVVAL